MRKGLTLDAVVLLQEIITDAGIGAGKSELRKDLFLRAEEIVRQAELREILRRNERARRRQDGP